MPEESDNFPELDSLLDPAFEQFRREVASQLEASHAAWLEARLRKERGEIEKAARTRASESLLEALQQIRLEQSVTGIAVALVEAAGRYARRTALFIQKQDRLLGFRLTGADDKEQQQALERLEIPLADAVGPAHAVETRDTVVCGGGSGELGEPLATILGTTGEDRAHLFPIVLRDRVLALLLADGDERNTVEQPAIEVLVSVSEAWIEAVGTRKRTAPQPEEAAV